MSAAKGAKLSPRDRAFALAAEIIDTRATEIEVTLERWKQKYPNDHLGSATERSAYLECQLLPRLIRDRMSPSGRAALSGVTDEQ